jgi:hypothetical protein
LTFEFGDGIPILTGYMVGWDSYHWVILDQKGLVRLVHKGSVAIVTILDSTVDGESLDLRAEHGSMVRPFLDALALQKVLPNHAVAAREVS